MIFFYLLIRTEVFLGSGLGCRPSRTRLVYCGLEGMGYEGDVFTWFRVGLRERLDRAITNKGWMSMHPFSNLCNLEFGKSNHRSIFLDTEHLVGVAERRTSFRIKFEAHWLAEETVEEIVKSTWQKAK